MTDDDPIEFYVDPVALALAELAEHVARLGWAYELNTRFNVGLTARRDVAAPLLPALLPGQE